MEIGGMDNRKKYIACALILAAAFAFGRYSAPEKIKIETKTVTVEVEKKDTVKSSDDNKRTVEITKPDGTKIVETETTNHKDLETHTDKEKATEQDVSKTVDYGRNRVTISALAGIKPGDLSSGLTYGAHVSKPILGPITIGAFGFTNGTFGMSLGLQF